MARFDVYANPDSAERKLIPFYLDVQSNFVNGMNTRVVVPLWKSGLLQAPLETLNPEFDISGQRVTMDTPSIGAAPANALRRPVDQLSSHQVAIQNALDMLFGSY